MSETPITDVLAEARRLEGAYVDPLVAPNYAERTRFWGTHTPAILAYVGELERELAGYKHWKEASYPGLLTAAVSLLDAGYKGDGIPDGIRWLWADRDRLAGEVERLTTERNEAVKLSRCECSSDELCENLVKHVRRAEKAEAEVTRLTAAIVENDVETDKDEAEIARLTARWEALKAWLINGDNTADYDRAIQKMAELEAQR